MLEDKCEGREREMQIREDGRGLRRNVPVQSVSKVNTVSLEQCLPLSSFISKCQQGCAFSYNAALPLTFFHSLQIVPYFGLLFTCFEMCKQLCLYRNGYIVSPLSYQLTPGVDQSLRPYELEEVKRYLKNRNFGTGESSFGNRW